MRIGLAAYNGEPYLESTTASLFAPIDRDFELLAADPASADVLRAAAIERVGAGGAPGAVTRARRDGV